MGRVWDWKVGEVKGGYVIKKGRCLGLGVVWYGVMIVMIIFYNGCIRDYGYF